ncbi:thiamine pyrophosphate-binding protein [Salicibibacter cibi]|uniref:Thiamine pyrophosphate-binding protein n=1 Tax=Salicibibacter cibi TaxID=2743001 RepID=A0A7T7CFR7_9BACI|nr:thiamine pyrophosphate-dependent enzyme [Salicibibacter cibi]QQK80279.1 thiamine pyrophosphate-binding protein [Salicibibacter cibi]
MFLSFPSDIMWKESDAETLPLTDISTNIRGDREAIKAATKSILEASNPVILAGDRIGSTNSISSLVALSELTGAQVYVEHQSAELNFPYTHQHFGGRCLPNGSFIKKVLSEADLVIFAGVISQAPLLYFDEPLVEKGTKRIAIDNSEWQIGKNMHVDIPILGHPHEVLKEIVDETKQHASNENVRTFDITRKRTLAKHRQRTEDLQRQLEESQENDILTPAQVIHELNQHLPENALIVDESVTSGQYVHDYLQLEKPKSFIGLKGGGLGYGMPASLGAQLGRPDQRVVNIIGDGSSLYYIQAIWNAAKHRLPVVFFVINNASYMILKGGLVNMDGEAAKKNFFPGMDLTGPSIDFVSVAKGFGVDAVKVENEEELTTALQQAFSANKPMLLDVTVDSTVKVFLK